MIRLKSPQIGQQEIEAVTRVLQSGMIAQGPEVEAFEKEFAEYCGTKYAIAVNSGTASIHAILAGYGIGPGDEVITTPFSFIATVSPILMCNATPVFADIDPKTFNIDPDSVRSQITDKTKAIIGVDVFGLCANWTELEKIAKEFDLHLVEDAAQAHGATHGGRVAGSFGGSASFSFYATKNMTTGEGGMITTNDPEMDAFCRRFRQHGMFVGRAYQYEHLGFNYRTTDINAAIGRVQLQQLPDWNARRREIADRLTAGLAQFDNIGVPFAPTDGEHVYHLYSILVPKQLRAHIMKTLTEKGVGNGIYYPSPLYTTKLFTDEQRKRHNCPRAEDICDQIMSIPVEPFLSNAEVDEVIDAIETALASGGES